MSYFRYHWPIVLWAFLFGIVPGVLVIAFVDAIRPDGVLTLIGIVLGIISGILNVRVSRKFDAHPQTTADWTFIYLIAAAITAFVAVLLGWWMLIANPGPLMFVAILLEMAIIAFGVPLLQYIIVRITGGPNGQ